MQFVLYFHYKITVQNCNDLRQFCVLHDDDSDEDPWQLTPPQAGAGLVQVLVWIILPPPQETLQEFHPDQALQPPLIAEINGGVFLKLCRHSPSTVSML